MTEDNAASAAVIVALRAQLARAAQKARIVMDHAILLGMVQTVPPADVLVRWQMTLEEIAPSRAEDPRPADHRAPAPAP